MKLRMHARSWELLSGRDDPLTVRGFRSDRDTVFARVMIASPVGIEAQIESRLAKVSWADS